MRLNYGILICLWISCWVRHVLTLAIPHPIDLLSRRWCPEEEVIPEVFQVSRRVTASQLFLWRWSSATTFWSPLCSALMCLCQGTYTVQSSLWCNHRAIQLKKVSKNSEKNLECASQPTSSIYKISGSNSSSSRSYKKDKFRLHLNYYFCQKICLFCNF